MEIPFSPVGLDSTRAPAPWDATLADVLVISPFMEAAVAVLDDSAYVVGWLPFEDGISLLAAADPLVCPEENVSNSCACKREFPESLEEGSTAKITEACNWINKKFNA